MANKIVSPGSLGGTQVLRSMTSAPPAKQVAGLKLPDNLDSMKKKDVIKIFYQAGEYDFQKIANIADTREQYVRKVYSDLRIEDKYGRGK